MVNASAVTEPVDVGSVTLIVASVLLKPDGSVAVTSTWRARTSASAANAACSAAGSDEITWPWPAVGQLLQRVECLAVLIEGDDVDEHLGVLDRRGGVASIGVSLVSAPSESTSRLRWPSVPATSTAWITPSYSRVFRVSVSPSSTAWAAARSVRRVERPW